MDTIRLFMWGYQRQFQASVQRAAEVLCRTLNRDLRVTTFLVGVLRDEREDRYPVCLEPEECGYSPEQFDGAVQQAEYLRAAAEPEAAEAVNDAHSLSHQVHEQRMLTRSLCAAILDVVKSGSRFGAHTACYCSALMPVSGYEVSVVLRWIYTGDNPPYELPRVHGNEERTTPKSLLDAAIGEFLEDCARSLNVLRPELVSRYNGRSNEELLRAAAVRLMDAPVWAAGNLDGLSGLFTACNAISALPYEGKESTGSMLIARDGRPNICKTISLHAPIAVANHRAVRKLLEISASGDSLLCDGANIYGFGRNEGTYEHNTADLFRVNFTRFYTWELHYDGQRLMRVAYGDPHLPQARINARKFRSDVKRIFPGIESVEIDRLLSLASAACGQKHGTILIINSQAHTEAARLESQCMRIAPIQLSPALIRSITAIDGAVLMDQKSVCYAVGAILDGLATPAGDPSRGARFNSSIRYVSGKTECMAVVVSEDGSVEWIPTPLPHLARKELSRILKQVEELLSRDELEESKTRRVLQWLRNHEFYLSADQCAKANELAHRFELTLREKGERVTFQPKLQPAQDLNSPKLLKT